MSVVLGTVYGMVVRSMSESKLRREKDLVDVFFPQFSGLRMPLESV